MEDRHISPNVSAVELSKLSKSKDINIRKQVARHPNTSPEILKQLFKRFPVEVLNNPVLDLLVIEDPNLYRELYFSNRYCFQRYELPLFYIEWAANYDNYAFRCEIAKSKKTPLFILEELILDEHIEVRCTVAENPNISDFIIKKIFKDNNIEVLASLATNINISPTNLVKLAEYKERDINVSLAFNINTPKYILKKLFEILDREERDILFRFSDRANVPSYILRKLSFTTNQQFLCQIAGNINTPLDVLNKLSQHKNFTIREKVATNENVTLEIKQKLLKDINKSVIFSLLDNQNIELHFLEEIASIAVQKHLNLKAIAKIVLHPNVSIELKTRMYEMFKKQFDYSNPYEHKWLAFYLEIMRLGWTKEMGLKYLEQTYGQDNCHGLHQSEFIEMYSHISNLPTP